MKPSVSVIVPAYNSARFLQGALSSVRSQKWPDLEIIVVDDGSKDETPAVLERLAASDLRVVTQANAGPGAARNAGIAAARNQWIALLDADDVWLPNKLSAQFAEIRRASRAAFCFADAIFRYLDGSEEKVSSRTHGRPLLTELLKGNMLHTSTLLIRRDCFDAIGLFDTQMRTGEDWDLWLRLAARYPSASVRFPLAIYRSAPYVQRYRLKTLEQCAILGVDHLYAFPGAVEQWPVLARIRPKVYAWQYAVLAKSYLRHGHLIDFTRLAVRAVLSHPTGIRYLTRRGRFEGNW